MTLLKNASPIQRKFVDRWVAYKLWPRFFLQIRRKDWATYYCSSWTPAIALCVFFGKPAILLSTKISVKYNGTIRNTMSDYRKAYFSHISFLKIYFSFYCFLNSYCAQYNRYVKYFLVSKFENCVKVWGLCSFWYNPIWKGTTLFAP